MGWTKEFAGVYYREGTLDLEHHQVHPRNRGPRQGVEDEVGDGKLPVVAPLTLPPSPPPGAGREDAKGRTPYAGHPERAGRRVLRQTGVRATQEGSDGAGEPRRRRGAPAHLGRRAQPVPQMRRTAPDDHLPQRGARQVLELRRTVVRLWRAGPGAGSGGWVPGRLEAHLRVGLPSVGPW